VTTSHPRHGDAARISLSVAFALSASVLFALGVVLQQRGTLQTSSKASDARFYVQVMQRPAWMLGVACQGIGSLFHLLALRNGEIVLVEPILMLSMVLALPIGAMLTGQHVERRQVRGAITVVVGLVFFLLVSRPGGGVASPPGWRWIAGSAAVAIFVYATARRSRHRSPAATAALLGAAAGAMFGLDAAYAKVFTGEWGNGILALLLTWSTYAVIVAATIGGALQLAALKTGVLAPVVAYVHVASLVVSVSLGLLVFQEQLARGNGALAASALSLWISATGMVALTGVSAGGPSPDRRPGAAATP
jgi:uncharacterized membrane protein